MGEELPTSDIEEKLNNDSDVADAAENLETVTEQNINLDAQGEQQSAQELQEAKEELEQSQQNLINQIDPSLKASDINNNTLSPEGKQTVKNIVKASIENIKSALNKNFKFDTSTKEGAQNAKTEIENNKSSFAQKFGSYLKLFMVLAVLSGIIAGSIELSNLAQNMSGCYQIDMSNGSQTQLDCGSQSICGCSTFNQLNNACRNILTPCSGTLGSGSGIIYRWKTYTPVDVLGQLISSAVNGGANLIANAGESIFSKLGKYLMPLIILIIICVVLYFVIKLFLSRK